MVALKKEWITIALSVCYLWWYKSFVQWGASRAEYSIITVKRTFRMKEVFQDDVAVVSILKI